jgi:hypothetical protein
MTADGGGTSSVHAAPRIETRIKRHGVMILSMTPLFTVSIVRPNAYIPERK